LRESGLSPARFCVSSASVRDPHDRLAQLERQNAELAAAVEQLQAREERWRTIVSTDPER
jgi:hypothetical protein